MFLGFFNFIAPVLGGVIGSLLAPKPKAPKPYTPTNTTSPDITDRDRAQAISDAERAAQFRLDQDMKMGEFSFGLRDREANNNIGRQKDIEGFQFGNQQTGLDNQLGRDVKLTNVQRGWEQRINKETQDAITGRNEAQLANQRTLQQNTINQDNFATNRAIRLASRRLGS